MNYSLFFFLIFFNTAQENLNTLALEIDRLSKQLQQQ